MRPETQKSRSAFIVYIFASLETNDKILSIPLLFALCVILKPEGLQLGSVLIDTLGSERVERDEDDTQYGSHGGQEAETHLDAIDCLGRLDRHL